MPRPVTRIAHNNCSDCGVEMPEVVYIRPTAKLCKDCKGEHWSANSEVKKIYKELRKKNADMIDDDDWSTEDDPRAKTEQLYGKVSKVARQSAYASVSTLDDVI